MEKARPEYSPAAMKFKKASRFLMSAYEYGGICHALPNR
jgi:hypothetical protein